MSENKADVSKMRLKVFFIGSFIVAFLGASIYLFISAYDDKASLATAPVINNDINAPAKNNSEKWH